MVLRWTIKKANLAFLYIILQRNVTLVEVENEAKDIEIVTWGY